MPCAQHKKLAQDIQFKLDVQLRIDVHFEFLAPAAPCICDAGPPGVKASFGIARTGVTSQVDAKVHLNLFDLGEWKPFGAYGRLTDASGTSRVGGIRFEHPDGHVFIGKGIYTPLTGMPRDYWTMQTVYKTSGNQWVHAAKYVADGQTWFVGAETLAAPNVNLGILGNFKPKFGAGIYYSSGPFPGIPMPTGFSPIDSVHSGATATINLRLFGKE